MSLNWENHILALELGLFKVAKYGLMEGESA